MNAVVFLGPSLRQDRARDLIPAHFRPPARRGDIYRAVCDLRPRVLVLIDGVFRQEPAVWHREILWAMSEGVHAIGAASMGALRAAELADYGMQGVGKIFAAYRAGRFAPFPDPFEDDAEVAVVHGPAELGSAPLTIALADIREVLAGAMARAQLDPVAARAALAAACGLFFAERTPERLWDALRADGLPAELCDAICSAADGGIHSLKSRDAMSALSAGAALMASDAPAFEPSFVFEQTLVWESFRRRTARTEAANSLRTIGASGDAQ